MTETANRWAAAFAIWLHAHSPLDSFFDVYDIPPGLSFGEVLLHQIGAGAVLAVHTDSYSSREWCRREVIEAKRRMVPMIVVDSRGLRRVFSRRDDDAQGIH